MTAYFHKAQLFGWFSRQTDATLNVLVGRLLRSTASAFPLDEIKQYFRSSRGPALSLLTPIFGTGVCGKRSGVPIEKHLRVLDFAADPARLAFDADTYDRFRSMRRDEIWHLLRTVVDPDASVTTQG